jgi:hypothetical protein
VTAKVVIYEAFVEGKLEAAKPLARTVHDLYFEPKYEEFRPRTIWSLSHAFTSAFKELDPIPVGRCDYPHRQGAGAPVIAHELLSRPCSPAAWNTRGRSIFPVPTRHTQNGQMPSDS